MLNGDAGLLASPSESDRFSIAPLSYCRTGGTASPRQARPDPSRIEINKSELICCELICLTPWLGLSMLSDGSSDVAV